MKTLSDNELKLLKVLLTKPLLYEDVVQAMKPLPEDEVKPLLFRLSKESLIVKHPVIGGGCRDCACEVQYTWRLTYAGRQATQSP